MNASNFDQHARWLSAAGTRRRVLHLSALMPVWAGLSAYLAQDDEAAARHKKKNKKCARAGQPTSKKRKKCCRGLIKGPNGRCAAPGPGCDVCASGCAFSSVQAAIDAAAPGATIRICAGSYLLPKTVKLDKNLALVGAGDGPDPAESTILDASGSDENVMYVALATVTLQGLRFTGGWVTGSGGGISIYASTVTMTDCTVIGNEAFTGGGIYSENSAVTITDCTVAENASTISGGGGIHNDGGNLTLTRSHVSGNTTDASGAGIFNEVGEVTLDASDVTGNTATGAGGGVFNNSSAKLTLVNGSAISGNTAQSLSGGGGVSNRGTVDTSGGSITGNTPDQCVDVAPGTGCP